MFYICAIHQFLHTLTVAGAGVFFLILLTASTQLQATEIPDLDKYIINGGYVLDRNNTILAAKNLSTPFIPASTVKLLTSLAALSILGPEYRFTTKLFIDSQQNLYILGSGDPFLVSEKISEIAETIARQGLTTINDIILDDSAFALEHPTPGSGTSHNPYDAQCSALGVNFNSLPLRILHNAKVQSSEQQTPYIPLMGAVGMSLTSGQYRININSFPDQHAFSNSLVYCGQLFQSLLQQNNILINGKIKQGKIPSQLEPFFTYTSKETVTDLVRSCLLSSSNFMANQLYLANGIVRYGAPATWEKGRRAMVEFISNHLPLVKDEISLTEGSGLSQLNTLTPRAMLAILKQFEPYKHLIPEKNGIKMKSGTLNETGVYCYAGYFTKGTVTNSFVIFLNQKNNTRDTILRTLYRQP